MTLMNFDIDGFLRDYWQKKPLLIRNPWAAWTNPLDPNDLAGLACEEDVEARIVVQKRDDWKVEHGPFAEKRFAKLGKHPWTLLVQAVDHVVPQVAALIDPFRFVPNWRIDDVMVSYASDGGGVGPHFDQYDVFLVQGLGRRRWRIGQACDATSVLLPNDDLRLLAEFHATDEWVLEPGDILYVPPGIAHDGVAVGDDCMTYSVGFRAPARSELIAHWCDHLLGEMAEDDRYADPDLVAQSNAGEISTAALDRLHAMVAERMLDRDAFARWFGAYTSTPKYPDQGWQADEPPSVTAVYVHLKAADPLVRNPASRFSFIRRGADVILFVDGESFDCAGDAARFAEILCSNTVFTVAWSSADVVDLIVRLIDLGSVAFDPSGDPAQ